MGLREVPRAESVKLGVIGSDETVKPEGIDYGGQMLDDEDAYTISDLKAGRAELLAALEKYRA
jgi:hypothetical protein